MSALRKAGDIGLAVLPAALTLYFCFERGGYFPGSQAFATVILLVCLAASIVYAGRPFSGLTRAGAIVVFAFVLFALLTLLSGSWSDSHARALLEFNRALLYLTAFLLFASVARDKARLKRMVWALTVVFVGVAGAALATRLLPETFPTTTSFLANRLSYPLTYWNALGVVAALGIVFSLHLASRARGPIVPRVLGAAAVPMLATTLLFTFSRGAIAAAGIGVVAYALAGRPRALISGLLAVVPFTVLAVKSGYGADALATVQPTSPEAVEQGRDVARTVVGCMLGAAVARSLLLLLDRRLAAIRVSNEIRRRWFLPAMAASALVLVVALAASGVPDYVDRQYKRFARGDVAQARGDFRARLGSPASPARQQYWKVGVRQFHRAEVKGNGAGTYQLAWEQSRPGASPVRDAHSLYLEVLAELGLVGFIAIAIVIGTILVALLLRARGPAAPLFGAVLAASVAWALHAGVDWDWELPAITLWLFALGGSALASRRATPPDTAAFSPILRILATLAVLALTIVPARLAISDRHLEAATAAFANEDCATAERYARASIARLNARPDPFELLGYCEIRAGHQRAAVRHMRSAVARDPHNWNYHYSLSVALATAGADPREEARAALRLNPLDPLTRDLVQRFRTRNRLEWASRANDVAESFLSL